MTVTELRRLYQDQSLIEAIVESAPNDADWILEFRDDHGGLVFLTDELGQECHYQNVQAAFESAVDIGFKQVRIAD